MNNVTLSIPERYKLLTKIGHGGMGVVYKARDDVLKNVVAVKILSGELNDSNSTQVQRFQREARAAGKLKHKNLVSVLDFGIMDEKPYLVMDYIEGLTLKRLLDRRNRLDVALSLELFLQIASGMEHAHRARVIHRDLKLSNIIVQEPKRDNFQIKIIDFGVAHLMMESARGFLTTTNAILGSPLFMSPEQINGHRLDERCDIYSLGCIMYFCLTGKPPFSGNTSFETMNMHLTEPIPSLSSENLIFSESLEALINKALAKDPDDRFQNMQEVISALEMVKDEFYYGDTIQLEASTTPKEQGRLKLNPSIFTILFAALLILPVMALSFYFQSEPVEVAAPKEDLTSRSSVMPIVTHFDELVFNEPENKHSNLEDELKRGDKAIKLNKCSISNEDLEKIGKGQFNSLDFRASEFRNNSALNNLLQTGVCHMTVTMTNFDDDGALAVSRLPNLLILEAGHTYNLTNKGIRHLATMKNLTKLELDNTCIDDASLKLIAKLPNLDRLQLTSTQISDKGLLYLASMENMKKLDIRWCKNISDDAIVKLKKALPRCKIDCSF